MGRGTDRRRADTPLDSVLWYGLYREYPGDGRSVHQGANHSHSDIADMATMTVNFTSCVQDSEDYGSDDQVIVSRVFFSIECEGLLYTGLHADIKQAVDSHFETDPLEVTLPHGYDGPISYEAFRRAVSQYFRALVACDGFGQQKGVGNIRMRDNTFLMPRSFEFPLAGS